MAEKITALRIRRDGRKVTVRLGEGRSLVIATILAAPLRVGQPLEEREIEELRRADRLEDAQARCLALIARRPRSRAELERYLRRRKLEEASADEVIRRLARRGLVDDGEFARAWVENRQALHPRSRRALRAELRRLGVAEEETQAALDGLPEREAALAAARRKAVAVNGRRTRHASPPADRQSRLAFEQKLIAHLAMRGFDYDLSRETARQVWEETRGENGRGELSSEIESEEQS
jgi:regulatory protein